MNRAPNPFVILLEANTVTASHQKPPPITAEEIAELQHSATALMLANELLIDYGYSDVPEEVEEACDDAAMVTEMLALAIRQSLAELDSVMDYAERCSITANSFRLTVAARLAHLLAPKP